MKIKYAILGLFLCCNVWSSFIIRPLNLTSLNLQTKSTNPDNITHDTQKMQTLTEKHASKDAYIKLDHLNGLLDIERIMHCNPTLLPYHIPYLIFDQNKKSSHLAAIVWLGFAATDNMDFGVIPSKEYEHQYANLAELIRKKFFLQHKIVYVKSYGTHTAKLAAQGWKLDSTARRIDHDVLIFDTMTNSAYTTTQGD